jgi:hypothetical protein
MAPDIYQTKFFPGILFTRQCIICVCFSFLIISTAVGQNGLDGIIVEKTPVSVEARNDDPEIPEGAFTYRIFVDMDTAFELQAVFALETHELFLATSTQFYNHAEFGATSGGDILNSLLGAFPSLAYDSYITINAASNNMLGILMDEDSTDGIIDGMVLGSALPMQSVGENFSIPFGTENYSGKYSTYRGIYSVIGGETGPTATNKVLIGQFTTDGEFSFELNIQIRRKGTADYKRFVARNPIGNDYLFAGLTYPGNLPPLITLISPENGSSYNVGDDVAIVAEASDESGISHVAFYVNDVQVFIDSLAPYQTVWQASEGNTSIMAVATDSLGSTDSTDAVEITVFTKESPIVSITSPLNGSSFALNSLINVTADASDTDGDVKLVEFYAGSTKIGEDNTAPFQVSWIPSVAGSFELHAVATDDDGLTTSSPNIGITINTITGFHDPVSDESLFIFPNPAKDKISIRTTLPSDTDCQLEVLDMHGISYMNRQMHTSSGNHSMILDLSSLPNGIYFMKVTVNKEFVIFRKVIKY